MASTWDVRKRLCDFALLAEMLDENYKIVIVGVNKKEKRSLPENVLAFERTDSTQKLAEIYSSADVLFNASIEETFGMPTAEALACGTPAIVYNTTASPELIKSDRGYVVPAKDLDSVREKIFELEKSPIHISVQNFEFDKRKQYEQYIRLYESLL